jgi:hypothetical protein
MATMTRAAIAEALFVSDLEPSQNPSGQTIQDVIDRMTRQYGPDGCAARMASEFGDHPDLAVRRMTWIRRIVDLADEPAACRS